MRMLSDSLAGGIGGNQGSAAAPATATTTPLSAWTVAASQGQLTPEGKMSTATMSSINAHAGIILAALLCALVGGLTLHTLLHCAFHYCGGRGGGSALPPAGRSSVLVRMPVAVYEGEGAAECAICLGEFADGDAVRLLPRCRHGFHVGCIDAWLYAHSSCPICRDSLLDEAATAAAASISRSFAAGMLILP